MIVAAMLVSATLPSHPKPIYHGCIALTDHSDLGCNSFDIYGCLTLVRVVAFLLLALNLLPNVLPWYHPLVIALLSLNLILIAVFCYIISHTASCPVIPLKFLGSLAIFKVMLASVPILRAWDQACYRGPNPVSMGTNHIRKNR